MVKKGLSAAAALPEAQITMLQTRRNARYGWLLPYKLNGVPVGSITSLWPVSQW